MALIAHYLKSQGVLAALEEQVHFTRRFGHDKMIDFVVVLLSYAISGEHILEVFQVAGWNQLAHDPNRSLGSNQTSMTTAMLTSVSQKATPVHTLTPGTIKENIKLGCGACNDPILTTIDTTNLRLVWIVKLNNESGADQIDNFNDFNLQDPNGSIYEGTGKLNNVFILSAGQTMLETEIFSFLPRPGVSCTLIARLGGSGITYDPVQFTF